MHMHTFEFMLTQHKHTYPHRRIHILTLDLAQLQIFFWVYKIGSRARVFMKSNDVGIEALMCVISKACCGRIKELLADEYCVCVCSTTCTYTQIKT